MKITVERSLYTLETWSGATETKDRIIESGCADAFENLIDELYPDGIDETSLNDFLWFESDWIYETLGISEEEEEA